MNKNNNLYYLHNDLIETTRAITNASGTPVWTLDINDAFSNSNLPTGSIEFNPRFMGQYYDSETDLSYNYYRYYSNELGRYIQSDPIGLNGGWNTYSYVENETFSSIDPLGLDVSLLIVEGGLATIGHSAININGKTYGLQPTPFFTYNGAPRGMEIKDIISNFNSPVYGFIQNVSRTDYIKNYNQRGENIHEFTLNLSIEDEQLLETEILKLIKYNKPYQALPISEDNCTTFTSNLLNKTNKFKVFNRFPWAQRLNMKYINNDMVTKYEIYKASK